MHKLKSSPKTFSKSYTVSSLARRCGYALLLIAMLWSSVASVSFPSTAQASNLPVAQLQPKTTTSVGKADNGTKDAKNLGASVPPTKPDPPVAGTPAPSGTASQPHLNSLSGNAITFVNSSFITINDASAATPYPSTMDVTGLPATVNGLTVTLYGISHTYPDDISILLVGPGGQQTILMSNRGGGADLVNINLTFDDNASSSLPASSQIVSGTYKPSDDEGSTSTEVFPSPAPAAPHPVTLSVFNGVNPNGTWKLYVQDTYPADFGQIASGWAISFYANQAAIITSAGSYQSTTVGSAFPVQLQATVKDSSTSPVSGASVTFTAPASGASGTFANGMQTYTGTTDASGIVTASLFTANGVASTYQVTATTATAPVATAFVLKNVAGSPASVTASSGSGQSAAVGTAFAQPLVATVFDSYSNPVSGTAVTFTAPASGASGTFAGNSATYAGVTNASGVVTSSIFTANSVVGSYAVTATAAGVGSPASFTLTNTLASTIQFQSSSYAVSEGAGTAVVTLTRGVNSTGAITGTVLISGTTASAHDYSLANYSVVADTTFSSTIGANGNVNDVVVQPDGKILIAGDFTTYNSTARNRIARLNSDGTLDTSFDPGVGPNNGIGRIALQPDGKIIIGGSFTTYNGSAYNRVARLNTDGSLDTSFDSSTGANSDVVVVAVQSGGKILIGGNFTTYNGTTRNRVAQLNADGSLDTNFDSSIGADNIVWDLVVQPADSKVVIVGRFTTYNGTSRSHIARLNTDGSLDTSFDPGTGATSGLDIWRVALQPDGNVLIGGDFTSYNGVGRIRIARLLSNGSLDTSFAPGTSANNGVRPIVVQPDGKILTSGDFTTFSGVSRNHITRLNADGSLDTSFAVGTGANDFVAAIALQADGRILIGGRFSTFNGTTVNRLARLGNALSVSWSAGDSTPKTITLTIVDDSLVEEDEQIALTLLSTSSGATLGSPISATLTIVDNDTPTITVVSGDGQSSIINNSFSLPLVARLKDASNNPVNGASVTFTAPASGASGTFVNGTNVYTGTTDASGTVTTTTFTANAVVGVYTVTATIAGPVNSASFTLTNLPPCNPLVVSSNLDDGSCGTLRTALSTASSGASKQVTISLTAGSVITLTSGLNLDAGVSITTTASCSATGPTITLQGSGNNSGNGLTLSSGNSVYGLWIRGFSGQQIVAPGGGGNTLRCIKATKT